MKKDLETIAKYIEENVYERNSSFQLTTFVETLKKIGMEEIESLGKEFNPNEHEAITQVPTNDFEPDTVAFVAQNGYKMGDRIIRPALVGVAKSIEEEGK